MSEKLSVNLLSSTDPSVNFDKTSTPLIMDAFEQRGHDVTLKSVEEEPTPGELLDCDVYIDRSPITDTAFFCNLALERFRRSQTGDPTPLMVDDPLATMTSLDKRRTHALVPELVPETYNLDGADNHAAIDHFKDDDFVIIKDPLGWYSRGMERVSPEEAHDRFGSVTDMMVQKYIKIVRGVLRVVAADDGEDFQVLSTYLMVPGDSWKTGDGAPVTFEQADCPPELQEFARLVTRRSGLYLNGPDIIERTPEDRAQGAPQYTLLENNAVPNLRVPAHYLGVDAPGLFVEHIERSAAKR